MKRKGAKYERDLQRRLWENGIVCLRVAGSGSSSFPALDLLAIKDGKVIGIEVKFTSQDKIYLDEVQLEELKKISEMGKFEIFIAVKFSGKEWKFFKLEDVMKNRKIDLDRAEKEGMNLKDVVAPLVHKKFQTQTMNKID